MRHGRARSYPYLREHAYVLRFRPGQRPLQKVRVSLHALKRAAFKAEALRLGSKSSKICAQAGW
jgi:hypothetical protein